MYVYSAITLECLEQIQPNLVTHEKREKRKVTFTLEISIKHPHPPFRILKRNCGAVMQNCLQ